MKTTFLPFIILLALFQATYAQGKLDFDELPTISIWPSDSTKSIDAADLNYEPITEDYFISLRSGQKEAIHDRPEVKPPDSSGLFIVHTLHSYYELRQTGEYESSYDYVGFIPALQCHLINHCGEGMCESFLLDHQSDVKAFVPSSYDAGAIDLLISPSEDRICVYSSYDGPDFDHYYAQRAEIFIFSLEKGKRLAGMKPLLVIETRDWSIEEAILVKNDIIALKIYEGQRSLAETGGGYRFLIAKL